MPVLPGSVDLWASVEDSCCLAPGGEKDMSVTLGDKTKALNRNTPGARLWGDRHRTPERPPGGGPGGRSTSACTCGGGAGQGQQWR